MEIDDEEFYQKIRIWNIIQKGFTESIADTELSSDAVKQLRKNRQLNCKTFYYFSTQIQLHVVKKFIHVNTLKQTWNFLINFHDHDGEKICDEEEEIKFFDETKK